MANRRLAGALGACAALGLGVVLAELSLRAAFAIAPSLRERATGEAALPLWILDDRLLYRPNPEHPEHDARGFRNPSALPRADVVTLGDSQTYGSGVTPAEPWPAALGAATGRVVYNMAFPGWGPVQSLLEADAALELAPRLVVASFYPGNDLYDAFAIVYGRDTLPELRSGDPALREAIAREEEARPLAEASREKFDADSRSLAGRLEQYSQLAAIGRRGARVFLEASGLRPSGWERARAICLRTQGDCEPFEGALRTLFTPSYRWLALDPDDPRIREGERIAHEALARLARRVRDAGAELVVLGIPTKERAYAESGLAGAGSSARFQRLVEAERALAGRTAEALAQAGVRFVDAAPDLARALDEGRACYRESTDGHPAPEGHRVLAAALEPWVRAAE